MRFEYLARGVPVPMGDTVAAMKIAGIGVRRDETRVVPGHDLAANLIGFTGTDLTGLGGLEASYDDVLRGVDGTRSFEIGLPDGPVDLDQEIPGGYHTETPARPGSSLVLTIDRDLQFEVQRILGLRMAQVKASVGAAVVLDVRTGEVLAQASYPFFDAANPFASDPSDRGDNATGLVVEPGSVHKGVVFAACLQEAVVAPTDSILVPPTIRKGATTFSDTTYHASPTLTLPGILAWSSNVGTIELADKLGADKLYAYQRAFGLGDKTGENLPGESAGLVQPPANWSADSHGSIPIGHGISVTPLQMAAVYATIANGGTWVEPHLVKAVVAPDGTVTPTKAAPTRQVISAPTAAELRTMLEAVVVAPGATGRSAAIKDYRVAGKTGTGRLIADGKPVPGEVGSFVGMAPADAPRYVVAVFTHTPGGEGGSVAGAGVRRHDGLHAAALRGGADRDEAANLPPVSVTPSPVVRAGRVGSGAVSGYPRPRTVAATPVRALAAVAGARTDHPAADSDVAVTGITHDSGSVRPGDLYAALPGAHRHGAQFADRAVATGAVAVLTDPAGAPLLPDRVPAIVVDDPRAVLGEVAAAVYGHPSARLKVIGITGTAGKTSTAYLVESGLTAAGLRTAMIGTVETRIPDLVVESVRTTPEATDLHALLAAALEQGAGAAVMEVSSHALAYGRVGGVRFEVGAWTNFGLDHLDFHTDVDDYFAAKARLFDGRCRVEILNLDDPAVRRLAKPGRLTYSRTDEDATWRAVDIAPDGFAQRFTALGPDGIVVPAGVAMPGGHNVSNALLAIACLVAAGIDPATAAAGVASCRGVPGRLELVEAPGPVLGVVDYAHKPDAIVAALAALRTLGRGRVICVIGAGGDRDRGKRPFMGEAAARGADVVVVTDDNPRTEDPATVRAAVRRGAEAVDGPTVLEIPGRHEAIVDAVGLARPGDVVALLGKGHERGQETAAGTTPFDDRIELARALSARFAGANA